MIRQLNAVMLTYVTRPMVWAIGGIYLLVLMVSGFYSVGSSQKVLQAAFPDDSGSYESTLRLEGAKAVQDFEQGTFSRRTTKVRIRWYLADSTVPHGEIRITPSGLRSLKECKHLKSLQIKHEGSLSEDEVQAISELQQLTRLSLHGVRVTSLVWQHVARLSRLKYLDLSGCIIDGDAPQLESMAFLQTLILGTPEHGGIQSRGTSFFEEIHRFPNLQTIVLGDYHNPFVRVPEREALLPVASPLLVSIEALRAVTSLRTLYVNDQSFGFPGFEELKATLPNVAVRPAFVDVRRMSRLLVIVFLNAAVLGLIAVQSRIHFAHPGAHLIPAYTCPHLAPPLFLWIGSIVNIFPLLASGVPIIPSIGVHAACWVSMTGCVVVGSLLQWIARLPRWISTPVSAVTGAVLGGGFPLMILAVFIFPSSFDWYLRGNEPWVAFALIVFGGVLPLIAILRSRRLYSVYLENGCDSPVLGLDFASIRTMQQRAYQRNDMLRRSWPQWMLGAKLETVIAKSIDGGWRERCQLWIAGNAFSGRVVPLRMGLGVLMFVPAQIVQFGFADYQSDLLPLMLICVLIPDFGMIFFLKQWWVRRSLSGMELLRPNSRQQYVRQIMSAIAWDLGPQGCVYLSLFAMLTTLADSTRMSVGWGIAMLLVALSRWVLVYGIILWLLLIRRDWLVFVTAVFAVYGLLFVNVGMLMLQASVLGVQNLPPDLPESWPGLVAGIATVTGLIGAVVVVAAYRRWQKIEMA